MPGTPLDEFVQAVQITFKDYVRPDGGKGLTLSEVDDLLRSAGLHNQVTGWRSDHSARLPDGTVYTLYSGIPGTRIPGTQY